MPYRDPFTPIQRQVWDELLRVTDHGRLDFVGHFTVPGLTGADIGGPLNSFAARGFVFKADTDPSNQKAGRLLRVLDPDAGEPIEVGEIQLTPQQRRVAAALLSLTANGTVAWEGVLRIPAVPNGTVANALATMRQLGVLEVEAVTGPLGYMGRRIAFLVDVALLLVTPEDLAADDDDDEPAPARKAASDAFARAWAKAFPGGADYRVGVFPPAPPRPAIAHPDILTSA